MAEALLEGGEADTDILPLQITSVNTFHLLSSGWVGVTLRAVAADLMAIMESWHQNGPAACPARLSFRGGINQTLARSLPTTFVRTSWRLTT
jgi:hypothetical protein